MKIDPKLKLEKIASVKDARPYLRDPHLDVKNKCLIATDGHKLVCIPVEVSPTDTSGPVPLDAIKDARKRKLDSAEIVCNGDATLIDSNSGLPLSHYERVDSGKFPDYERVLQSNGLADDSEVPVVSVRLNAKCVLELAQALSSKRGHEPIIRLDIFDDSRAVRVVAENEPDRVGVLMPCRK